MAAPTTIAYLHVINNPDEKGLACNFSNYGISLPTINDSSMPYFPNYRLGAEQGSVCDTLSTSIDVNLRKTPAFTLSPNPVKDVLHLAFRQGSEVRDTRFEVRDIYGQIVHHGNMSGDHIRNIDVSVYTSGTYFCILKDKDGQVIWRGKFVVKK